MLLLPRHDNEALALRPPAVRRRASTTATDAAAMWNSATRAAIAARLVRDSSICKVHDAGYRVPFPDAQQCGASQNECWIISPSPRVRAQ
jgi:hypothetical protein